MDPQLTVNPICPICKTVQLTNEEIAKSADGKGRCWYCICDTFSQIGMETLIGDPAAYGRPNETVESGIARSKQKFLRPAIDQATIDAVAAAPGATLAVPGKAKPLNSTVPIKFTDAERKAFITSFGTDPQPKVVPTEIIVHGTGDDTYLKFSVPVAVDAKEEQEIKRILGSILDIFGKLLKVGPQFASTLIDLQSMSGEMFIGGKR